MLEVRLTAEADDELAHAFDWYESCRSGLGSDFLACVEAALAASARSPAQSPTVHRDIRQRLVRRFPYAIYFVVRPGYIRVLSVFHLSRDPAEWRGR